MNKLFVVAVVALGLAGCDTTYTAMMCTDAAALQASQVKLNAPQTTALNGIVQACAATNGGTVMTNATMVNAIAINAVLLQGSGLLSNVHIRAQAPEDQRVLERVKLHWDRFI